MFGWWKTFYLQFAHGGEYWKRVCVCFERERENEREIIKYTACSAGGMSLNSHYLVGIQACTGTHEVRAHADLWHMYTIFWTHKTTQTLHMYAKDGENALSWAEINAHLASSPPPSILKMLLFHTVPLHNLWDPPGIRAHGQNMKITNSANAAPWHQNATWREKCGKKRTIFHWQAALITCHK